MKKSITILSVTAILLTFILGTAMPMSVQAMGNRSRARSVDYPVCGTEDCLLTGLHEHDGQIYASHYYGDGHDYHGYCEVADCTLAGYHGHDGAYCFARANDDSDDNYFNSDYGYGCCRSGRNGRGCY